MVEVDPRTLEGVGHHLEREQEEEEEERRRKRRAFYQDVTRKEDSKLRALSLSISSTLTQH